MGEADTPPHATPPGEPLAADDRAAAVESDLPCYRCDYNLRSLRLDAQCPECGYAVKQSTGLYVTKQWPYNVVEPCRALAFGLITMIAMGLGLVPWALGFAIVLWRMPGGPLWSSVKHAAWLSYLSIVGCIVVILTASPFAMTRVGMNALLLVFTGALLTHYACVFAVAIRITRIARMTHAMWVAVVCAAMQGAVAVALLTQRSIDAYAIILMLCGLWWMLFGTFYWSYIANTLEEKSNVLLHTATGAAAHDPPTHTV